MNKTTKEVKLEQLGSQSHPKVAAINALYQQLSDKRQAQIDRYAACLQAHDFPIAATQDNKIRLLANEVFNGVEEGFETRLNNLSKIQSEDDAYDYMNKAYQQEERLEFDQSDEVQDAMNSKNSTPTGSNIETYLAGDKANTTNNDYE
ncbi:hypothetical protein [Cysteiniphilum sp. JM-1]|uniref:hypothetical protein n=1 Tax=Cysteiniphilum sp. JM-1 TaxID=2610891 RepID=UPI00124461DB|nr:hypothetical protein [Cysteiniphilum sp. JM-1]